MELISQGEVDRVILGLLPSSRIGWEAAMVALKTDGGWLHLHHNVKDSEETDWMSSVQVPVFSNIFICP